MSEIVIYDFVDSTSAFYHIRNDPVAKKREEIPEKLEEVKKEPFFTKLKRFFWGKIKEGEKIKAVLSIKCVKACTDVRIGSSIGATMGKFRLY